MSICHAEMDLLQQYQRVNSVVNTDNEAFARELIEKLNASAEQSAQQRQIYEKKIRTLEDKLAIANANAAAVGGSSASFVTNLKHKLEAKVTETYEYKELHGRYRRLAAEHCKLQADQTEIVHRSISQLEQTYQQSLGKLNQYVAELREQSERAAKDAYRARGEIEVLRDENRRAELTISELVKSRDRAEQLVRESQAAQLSLHCAESEALQRTATTERGAQASPQPVGKISKQLQTRSELSNDQPTQEGAAEVNYLRKELMMSQHQLEASYQQLAELQEVIEPFGELKSRVEACSALEEQLAQRTGQLVSHQREIMQLNRRIQQLREEIISQKIVNAAANARSAQMPYLQEQIKLLAAACERQPAPYIDRDALLRQKAEAEQLLAETKDDADAAETLHHIIAEADAALEGSQADNRVTAGMWEEVARRAAKMQTAELLMLVLQLLKAVAGKSADDVAVAVGALLQQFASEFIAISASELGKPAIGDADLQWLGKSAAAAFARPEVAEFAQQTENALGDARNQACYGENSSYIDSGAYNDARKAENMALRREILRFKKENERLRQEGESCAARLQFPLAGKQTFPLPTGAFYRIVGNVRRLQDANERSLTACARQLARARKICRDVARTATASFYCVERNASDFEAGVLARSSALLQRLSDGLADSQAENSRLRGRLAGLTMKSRLGNSQRGQ